MVTEIVRTTLVSWTSQQVQLLHDSHGTSASNLLSRFSETGAYPSSTLCPQSLILHSLISLSIVTEYTTLRRRRRKISRMSPHEGNWSRCWTICLLTHEGALDC